MFQLFQLAVILCEHINMFPSLGCFIYSFSPCNRVLVEYGSVLLMFMCISHVHKYRVGVKIGQAGKYPGQFGLV